jgi:biopolymer transport protein ExbD
MARAKKIRIEEPAAELNITSLMDIMTIILVFLLKSYSTEEITVTPSDDLSLPNSSASLKPELAVNTVVTKSAITVDGVDVVAVLGGAVDPGQKRGTLISPLFDRLKDLADREKANAERPGYSPFSGRLLLQIDRDIPFGLVREVMYTAGQAQFGEFKFVVYGKEG